MRNLYIIKITEYQAQGHQIDIKKDIAKSFFEVDDTFLSSTDSKDFNFQLKKNPNVTDTFPLQAATNPRLSSKILTFMGDNGRPLSGDDFLVLEKIGKLFCVDTIRQSDADYQAISNLFPAGDSHLMIAANFQLNPMIDEPLQKIFYGAPGTGKSHKTNEMVRRYKDTIRTTFHPDSDYASFVGCYKPVEEEVEARVVPVVMGAGVGGTVGVSFDTNQGTYKEKRITYKYIQQAFVRAYVSAWKKEKCALQSGSKEVEPQFLVIEEINRGNCAQIFGDLFQLLDRNGKGYSEYAIEADADLQKELHDSFSYTIGTISADDIDSMYLDGDDDPITYDIGNGNRVKTFEAVMDGKILLLPNNLYIWATMNTSDQSLFPMDSAFKRRWDWECVPINNAGKNFIIEVDNQSFDWWEFVKRINGIIYETTHSEDKKLGYFFCKPTQKTDGATDNDIITAKTFVNKVLFYLWNDVLKDEELSENAFNDGNERLAFGKFFSANSNINTDVLSKFLTDLGLQSDDLDEPTPGTTPTTTVRKRDMTKYSVNNDGRYGKHETVLKVVDKYAEQNGSKSADEIVQFWKKIDFDNSIKIPHIVETETEYNTRVSQATDGQPRAKKIELSNNRGNIYVSTQVNIKTMNAFKDAVNKNNTELNGITIVPLS